MSVLGEKVAVGVCCISACAITWFSRDSAERKINVWRRWDEAAYGRARTNLSRRLPERSEDGRDE